MAPGLSDRTGSAGTSTLRNPLLLNILRIAGHEDIHIRRSGISRLIDRSDRYRVLASVPPF